MEVLTTLHGRVGGPSDRQIASSSGREISSSSAANLLNGVGKPRRETVRGFIHGCLQYAKNRKWAGLPKPEQPEEDEGWWYQRYVTAVRAMPAAPAASTATPGVSLLPVPASHFVGRDDDLQEVLNLLEQRRAAGSPVGVHVFDGMGGVGKTELVVQIGHQVAGEFPDGVVFLDLAGYRQGMEPIPPGQALHLLLAQRGIVSGETQQSEAVLRALWRSECAGRRILIILDNARDQEQVVPLLPDAAQCLVLVTTRRAFIGLPGSTLRKLELLSPEKAVDLLRSTAGLAHDQHGLQIEEVVRLCGHLPLAIVIAGSMLAYRPGYTPAELASDLQHERAFLDDLDEDDGSLHSAVHACLRLSCRNLPDELMRAFRLCGWHPGPEVTEPALAVMFIEPSQDCPVRVSDRMITQARRLLMGLADRNLLRMQADTHRFRMHDLVRASVQLLRSDDAEHDREHVLARLNRAYLVTLVHVERWRIGGELPRAGRGLPRAWLQDSPLDVIPDLYAAEAWVRRERENLLAFVDVIDSRRSAFALDILAGQLCDLGMLADAEHCYRAAERGFGMLGLEHARAHVLRGLAHVVSIRGDHAAAHSAYSRSRAISRRIGDNFGLAMTLAGLGELAYAVDDLDGAESYLQRAVKLFAEDGLVRQHDRVAVREYGRSLVRLGKVQHAQGRVQSAMELMKRAQEAYSLAGDVRSLQGLIPEMANICWRMGNVQVARDVLNRLMDEQLSDDTKAEALWHLGRIEAATGDPVKAITLFGQSLHLHEESKQPLGRARALLGLADAERLAGRLDEAQAHFEQSRRLCVELDDRSGVAQATLGLGDVAQATGEHTLATRQWQEVLLLAPEIGVAGSIVTRQARARLGQDANE